MNVARDLRILLHTVMAHHLSLDGTTVVRLLAAQQGQHSMALPQELHQATKAFVEEDYDTALQLYDDFLAKNGSDTLTLSARAAVHLQLKKYDAALQDASTASKVDPDYEIAHYRKGLAAFFLSDWQTAEAAFKRGSALLAKSKKSTLTASVRKYDIWLRKCKMEIENQKTPVEASNVSKSSNGPTVPPVPVSAAAQTQSPPNPVAHKPVPAPAPIEPTIRYQWYQSPTHVNVSVLVKDIKPEDTDIAIAARHLKVVIRRTGQDQIVIDGPLFDSIVPEQSRTSCLKTKVELKLQKASKCNWDDLLAKSTKEMAAKPAMSTDAGTDAEQASPAVKEREVARPYASRRDWNKMDKELTEELEKEAPGGEEALNKLFKDIYSKASDETRRAMVKSFQTSGGTVLSTNWDEVAKTDYEKERDAPDGMQWQTWEGKKIPHKKNKWDKDRDD